MEKQIINRYFFLLFSATQKSTLCSYRDGDKVKIFIEMSKLRYSSCKKIQPVQ